ncbi:MAG: thioredoxin family protein [Thermodesulfovibrionales bacterium]
MTERIVEIFSAGCPVCEDAVKLVKGMAHLSCAITVLDMRNPEIAARASSLGIRSVPAVVIDGKVADCCAVRGVDENTLRAAGLGKPLT